ncbi:gti1 pac2 family [Fusarium longipes]|uniref:Gti1 pac2 family n=1 Tax=Fusarium longipes TaxID=694270 RepID=A0A395RN73_9HYPO|nr:gti1 pac2 family [Fusarium longipes]
MTPPPLQPTYTGFIESTYDALIIFEACLNGDLHHVARRPHDRERQELIKSGNVFIYEESCSGIKRWTDGVSWSPSRILGNFLVYRELKQPFPPGEKKRACKKPKSSGGVAKSYDQRRSSGPISTSPSNNIYGPYGPPSTTPEAHLSGIGPLDANGFPADNRDLVGSLVDSYDFKPKGLVKKTISITYQGVPHHLVSYYDVADVRSRSLTRPTQNLNFRHITPRVDLLRNNFRSSVDDEIRLQTPSQPDHRLQPIHDASRGMYITSSRDPYTEPRDIYGHVTARDMMGYADYSSNYTYAAFPATNPYFSTGQPQYVPAPIPIPPHQQQHQHPQQHQHQHQQQHQHQHQHQQQQQQQQAVQGYYTQIPLGVFGHMEQKEEEPED